ncbi:sterol desaturase family protein [Turneriella parva]|uniref:Fatty acid hydroxylase n=1 Tax=Turneriella parva (strain ATCC BAA-1111 / DSM 21527 / NCTC 11395 / H) TaxID=869212 RepID=I4BBG1_TURPD|nr:sterol desaturase family protein [Turneriella parva]AFM14618.1 fatty acid hydroxylase [Turneriella parva DSM 21527]
MGDNAKFENLIALAVPVFFISIAIEIVASLLMKRKVYRFNDSVSDLSAGMLQELVGVFTKVLLFGVYIMLFDAVHRPANAVPGQAYGIPVNIVTWIVVFLLVDFVYYWFHRNSHNIAVIWGSHEAHHSSQEYNLSVALRQGAFQRLFSFPYYLPMALVGFSPVQFMVCSQINTLYQFFIHTRLVKKLGFLEYFMNTPSHHRVHHGVNPKYIDKNHAGMLIIWDKMFGTFQPEDEEPYYGTVKPLTTFNPVWAQLHYWWHLIQLSRQSRGLDKIKVWFKGPGWKPEYLGGKAMIPEINPNSYQKYDAPNLPSLKAYAGVVFAMTLPVFLIMQQTKGLPLLQQAILALPAIIGLAATGGLMMRKKWGLIVELVRIPMFFLLVLGIASLLRRDLMLTTVSVFAVVTVLQLAWLLREYRQRSVLQFN